jgi:hypothetical protein
MGKFPVTGASKPLMVVSEQTPNNLRHSDRVNALHIHLNELCEFVLVQVQNQVVHEVEAVIDDDKGKLIRELRPFQEVLVVVALSVDSLYLTNLTRASSSLDVLEVHFGILTDINDGARVV